MKQRKFDDFDQYSARYEELLEDVIGITGVSGDYFNEYKIKELKENLADFEPRTILDFGCGIGKSIFYMDKYFPSAYISGVDVSKKSIEKAAKSDFAKSERIELKSYDGIKLPYQDETFEVVFTSMVFHHISFELHNNLLSDIRRVLRPNGRFYIFEHNPFNPLTRKAVNECEFDHDAILLKPSYTRKALQEAEFKNLETQFKIFMPRTGVFKRLLGLEKYLNRVPIGAQYFVKGTK